MAGSNWQLGTTGDRKSPQGVPRMNYIVQREDCPHGSNTGTTGDSNGMSPTSNATSKINAVDNLINLNFSCSSRLQHTKLSLASGSLVYFIFNTYINFMIFSFCLSFLLELGPLISHSFVNPLLYSLMLRVQGLTAFIFLALSVRAQVPL